MSELEPLPDDISFRTNGNNPSTLPPNTLAIDTTVTNSLNTSTDDVDSIIADQFNETLRELDIEYGELITQLSIIIGETDNLIGQSHDTVAKLFDKEYDKTLKEQTSAEIDMATGGFNVPIDTYTMAQSILDQSGQWVIDAIGNNTATREASTLERLPGTIDNDAPPDVPIEPAMPVPLPPIDDTPIPIPEPEIPLPIPGPTDPSQCVSYYYQRIDADGTPSTNIPDWLLPLLPLQTNDYIEADGARVREWCLDYVPQPPMEEKCECKCPEPEPPVSPSEKCETKCPAPEINLYCPPPPPTPPEPEKPKEEQPPNKLDAEFQPGPQIDLVNPHLFWDVPAACISAQNFRNGAEEPIPAQPGFEPNPDPGFLNQLVTTVVQFDRKLLADLIGIFGGINNEAVREAEKALARDVAQKSVGAKAIDALMKELNPLSVPNPNVAAMVGGRLAVANLGEKVTGFPATYLVQAEQYLFQWANPQYLPSQSEINHQYLNGIIELPYWNCLTRALGNLPNTHLGTVEASRARPNIHELVQLYLRGEITRDAFDIKMRHNGVLNQIETEEFVALAQFVPGSSDIVRFMQRDVFDDNVAKAYNLDKDFITKLYGQGGLIAPGPAAQWMAANGINQNTMQAYWRAHWDIPSNTALYEMLHRLRPDRPEYQKWLEEFEAWNLGGQVGFLSPPPNVVKPDDVQRAIEVNDMSPAWVSPLMAISYRPITRTDAARAHEIGVFTDDDLYHAMRDNGYDDANSKILVNFYRQLRDRRKANVTGVWTTRKIVRAYKEGTLTLFEAKALLTPLLPNPNMVVQTITQADLEIAAETWGLELKRMRRGFIIGELDELNARQRMINEGMDAERIDTLITRWKIERDGRYKEATLRLLREWADDGILTADEMEKRLIRLGYSVKDANRIIYSTQLDINRRVNRELKQLGNELEKRFKNAQEVKKAEEEELVKRAKEIKKELDRIQKELDKRKGMLNGTG